MYTTAAWVQAFCRELTNADRAYFEGKDAAARDLPPRDPRYAPPSGRGRLPPPPGERPEPDAELERELEEEGL